MANIDLLIQGYALKEASGRYHASSATVLVRSMGKNVLIDPGLYPKELKAALEQAGLHVNDIDLMLTSHSHQDHVRNARLFDKSRVLDLLKQYRQIPEEMVVPGTEIKAIFTPGHVEKHVSFLAETAEGKYAIAGDVFWWEDSQEQKTDRASLLDLPDPLAVNMEKLRESRLKLLSLADFIIPGHGEIFAVKR
jgi:glyoxylase-like metal-dependent hydrolase (beta-lactamase superfamily II)